MTPVIRKTENFEMVKASYTGAVRFINTSNNETNLYKNNFPENKIVYLVGCSSIKNLTKKQKIT